MSLVVVGASTNIARVAQTLGEPLIFVQLPGSHVPDLIRDDVDEAFTLDFRDERVLARFAEEILSPRRPKAVVSVTEGGLQPAAVLSTLLGTPATSVDVVRVMRDKLLMRELLAQRAPQLSVAFADARDEDAVAKLFAGHDHVIVKPVSGTASEGVRRLDAADEARLYTDGNIFEEYVDGPEYSVESFSRAGRHDVVAIVEKGVAGHFVEVSHLTPPTTLTAGESNLIERSVRELLDALGLRDGPAHTELKVSNHGVKIIETHNRPGGDGIADLVAITCGLDWRRLSLGWPLGESPVDPRPRANAAAITYFTAPPGTVTRTTEPACVSDGVTVEDWAIEVKVGDVVNDLRSSRDRVGWAIVSGTSAQACHSAVAALRAQPVVVTEAVS
ncbi:ATP-grasp domain-containing protein [Micromonospora sp. WMMD1120]|uniref:ATP-grasp domain-containing protein n=1 Tax=Micromonospora sp. WMMD1120 TaxID=3016106 RepID=UPI00241723FB|nr:ATP-grasp domain-containing protein [Micromonospora sp. WMMD1120]MDG4808722.1 ATP-grasp domain-containing protein [Micromonospora sp. WMMD1120]